MINGSTSTQYLNQVNFSKYYNETLHGNLTLVVESKGYELRKLYIDFKPYTLSNNIMYLLPSGASVYAVLFRVYERSGGSGSALAIENVVLNVYKYISGTRTFLGQAKTDSNGLTFFNMNYLLADYEIILTKNGFVTQTLTTIPNVQEYTILMIPEGTQTGYGFSGFSYKFYPENPFLNSSVVNFSVSIIDENNALSISTFKITGTNVSRTNISLNSNGGLLFLRNININTTKYLANLTVIRNGVSYQLLKVYSYKGVITMPNATTEYAKTSLQNMEGWDKLFLVVFSYIAVAGFGVMISGSPAVGLFVGLFPLMLFWQFGLVSAGFLAVATIFTVIGGFYTRGA
jgi:hypothetical protein